jgi:hypothetical protein
MPSIANAVNEWPTDETKDVDHEEERDEPPSPRRHRGEALPDVGEVTSLPLAALLQGIPGKEDPLQGDHDRNP